MSQPIRILYIDDSLQESKLVLSNLTGDSTLFQVLQVTSRTAFDDAIAKGEFDLILSDFNVLGFENLQVLTAVKEEDPDTPVVFVTTSEFEETALESLKNGAADYVIKKPHHIRRLPSAILAVLERKQMWMELGLAAERIRSIYDNASEGIYRSTKDGCYLQVNKAMARMYGYDSPDEMIEAIRDIPNQVYIYPEDRTELIRQITEKGKVENYKIANYRKDGTIIWIQTNACLFQELSGQIVFEGFVTDITAQMQVEEELRYSEDLYRDLKDHVNDLVATHDLNGRILSVNLAATHMLGYEREELLQLNLPDILAAESQSQFGGYITRVERDGMASGVISVQTKSGEARIWEFNSILHRKLTDSPLVRTLARDITERRQAEDRIKQQIVYLTALKDIDCTILSSVDMKMNLHALIARAVVLLKVDAAAVLLVNPKDGTLEYSAGSGFYTGAIHASRVKFRESHAGMVASEQRMIHMYDLREESGNQSLVDFLKGENFVSYYGMPLIVKGKVIGVMEAFGRSPVERNQEWFDFFEALAGKAAIAIDKAKLFEHLRRSNHELKLAYKSTIEGWSRALDLRDRETEGHTLRVTEKTIKLAQRMGFTDRQLVDIRYGALLHDIGKMGVPDRILLKPDKLTEEEWTIMRKHPVFAYELLSPIRYLKSAAISIPYCHHEKWDGTGYPHGLKGDQIPLAARIFTVVDVYDALTSDRPYRPAWSREKVLKYIKSQVGIQFDPEVVVEFLKLPL